jgi:glycosyltransferase involved in cell wall biosynthesis
MKISLFNNTDIGGAYRAAKNYQRVLSASGKFSVDYFNLSEYKNKKVKNFEKLIELRRKLHSKSVRFIRFKQSARFFSLIEKNYSKSIVPLTKSSDVINIHWLGNGFTDLSQFMNETRPIIMTLHDSWILTGGCHLPGSCLGLAQECNNCPDVRSRHSQLLIDKDYLQKREFINKQNVLLVSPSAWLKKVVEQKVQKECTEIPNPFIPSKKCLKKHDLRKKLKLNTQTRLIMVSGVGIDKNRNKGGMLLQELIQNVQENIKYPIKLLVVGNVTPIKHKNIISVGLVKDQSEMADYYRLADVFVSLSKVENLPYAVIEACYYGAYPVCFKAGGVSEILTKANYGKLIRPGDFDSLCQSIVEYLRNPCRESLPEVKNNIISSYGTKKFLKCFENICKF